MPLTGETVGKLALPSDGQERNALAARLILEYEHAISSINDLCWRTGTKICFGISPDEIRGYIDQRSDEVRRLTELADAISEKLGEFGVELNVDLDCFDTVGARLVGPTAQFMKAYSRSELWKMRIEHLPSGG